MSGVKLFILIIQTPKTPDLTKAVSSVACMVHTYATPTPLALTADLGCVQGNVRRYNMTTSPTESQR